MTRKRFALLAVAVVLAGTAITGGAWASARSAGDGTAKTTVGHGAGMMVVRRRAAGIHFRAAVREPWPSAEHRP